MKKDMSDLELAELADWAESHEKEEVNPETKRAYGAIRQGADWLIRVRIKARQKELEAAGNKAKADQDAPARKM